MWMHSIYARIRRELGLAIVLAAFLLPVSGAEVPVRISVKFILNSTGHRPASGNINSDAEVNAQFGQALQILSQGFSELRMIKMDMEDVAGISQWYTNEPSNANRDALVAAAKADKVTYHWRDDAINVYINASRGDSMAAISKFPPGNQIILISQGAFLTTLPHEVGHSLNLMHTHEPCCGGDGCNDKPADNENWSRDDIALNAYGHVYNDLTAAQQNQVNLTWNNLMSYHDPDHRSRLSQCQMDRMSTQSYTDRNWLLGRIPVYVDAGFGGSHKGTFTEPYQTIQQAINASALNDRVLVLEQGTHAAPSNPISTSTDVVTRKGPSTIQELPAAYILPYALENSKTAGVRQYVIQAQRAERIKDIATVISNLANAEKQASGEEKNALQLELAQRYRDEGNYLESASWYRRLLRSATQPGLQNHAQMNANEMELRAANK